MSVAVENGRGITGDRLLQLEGDCTSLKALNTTYNLDERVPTYVGIMFEISPKVDMELLTLELDVRIPEGDGDVDLSVEVYSMKGSFEVLEAYDYDPNKWFLISKTTGVLLPGKKGLIIPTNDFNTLEITRGERRSFYVTMKKPYLDHNVMALQKTGELQLRTDDLDLLVGVGFNEYKFPGDFDRMLDPQFAGILHYRRTTECKRATSTTTVDYALLLEETVTPKLVTNVNRYIEEAVLQLFQQNSVLKTYQKYYGLQPLYETKTTAKTFEGRDALLDDIDATDTASRHPHSLSLFYCVFLA